MCVLLLCLQFLFNNASEIDLLEIFAAVRCEMIRFFGDFTRFFREKLFRFDRLRSCIGILFIGLICFHPATQPYGAVLGGWFLLVCVINMFAD